MMAMLFLSILGVLFFDTNIFFEKITLEPISIFYSVSSSIKIDITINNQSSYGSYQKYNVLDVEFNIEDPLKEKWNEFRIIFEDPTIEVDFWEPQNGYEKYNDSKENEYVSTHVPDYLINASFIKNGYVPVWSQIWIQQPTISVITEPFLQKKAYGVWEGYYFFNDRFSGTKLLGDQYLRANVEKLTFKILISDKYRVLNEQNYEIEKLPEEYLYKTSIKSGSTLDFIIVDVGMEQTKNILIWIFRGIIFLVIGIFVRTWWSKR